MLSTEAYQMIEYQKEWEKRQNILKNIVYILSYFSRVNQF